MCTAAVAPIKVWPGVWRITRLHVELGKVYAGPPTGGGGGAFCPGPQPERGPRRPHEGPLEYLLKDRYTLIEQSDLNTLIEQSQYSSEEQCSKLIDKEIWLHGNHATISPFFKIFFLVFNLQLG